jgi:WD40 repeat protein
MDWSVRGQLALWVEHHLQVYDLGNLAKQKQVRLWQEYDTGHLHSTQLTTLRWSPDGAWLAAGSSDGNVLCWQPATGKLRLRHWHENSLCSLVWSRSFLLLISAYARGPVTFWDVDRDIERGSWQAPYLRDLRTVSLPGSDLLAVASQSQIWVGKMGRPEPAYVLNGQTLAAGNPQGSLATLEESQDAQPRIHIYQL